MALCSTIITLTASSSDEFSPAVSAVASAGSAVAAVLTVSLAIVGAARRPTAVERLLELDEHIDDETHAELKKGIAQEISEHTADLIARRRHRHLLVPEAFLWSSTAALLAGATLAPSAPGAGHSLFLGWALVIVLVLYTAVLEFLRLDEHNRLLGRRSVVSWWRTRRASTNEPVENTKRNEDGSPPGEIEDGSAPDGEVVLARS